MLYGFPWCGCAKKEATGGEGSPVEAVSWEEDHVAFALGELGLRLHDFYDMPWCEYLIKSYAYQRLEKEKYRHTRFIAFHALIGPHVPPKTLPKTIEQFMPLGDYQRTNRASENLKSKFLEGYKDYLDQLTA